MAKGKKYGDTAKIPQSDFSVRAEREVLRNSPKNTYHIKKSKWSTPSGSPPSNPRNGIDYVF